jgi:transcription-repair coupling factor (superfamily II helicase)
VMYKRISAAHNQEDLDDIRAEAIDRFGFLPESAKILFRLSELRFGLGPLGIARVDFGPKGGRIVFSPDADIDPARLISLIESTQGRYQMKGPYTLIVKAELEDSDERIDMLKNIVTALGPHL